MNEWPDETIDRLQAQITALTQERDRYQQALAKINSDAVILRELLHVTEADVLQATLLDTAWQATQAQIASEHYQRKAIRWQAVWRARHDQVKARRVVVTDRAPLWVEPDPE